VKSLVSIIIPLYNSKDYIIEAIDSVLSQTYKNIEVIVIDDGSSDGSYDLVKEKYTNGEVKLLNHENHINKGVSKTRKLGIEHSKGEYIAFLDSDDTFKIDKIEQQVRFMDGKPYIVLCHSAVDMLYSNTSNTDEFRNEFILANNEVIYDLKREPYFLKANMICNSTVLVRKDTLTNLNFESNQIFQFEDWLTWVLLSYQGKFAYLPKHLTNYRYHDLSATSRIVKNKLVGAYSYVEFLLTLFTKIEDNSVRARISTLLKEVIVSITEEYRMPLKSKKENYHSMLFGENNSNLSFKKIAKKILNQK